MKNYSPWIVRHSDNRYYLRREKLPRVGYAKWESYNGKYDTSDKDAVESLKRRLNATHEQKRLQAEARYDFDHAYVNKRLIELFEIELGRTADNASTVQANLSYLKRAFDFYIVKKRLPSPVDWYKYQSEFGKYIESLKLSARSIQGITQATNRYLSFLHNHFPTEIPLIKLTPIAPKKIKAMQTLTAEKMRDGSRFVDDKAWQDILARINPEIKPHVALAYAFGLRRAEVLGLTDKSFYRGYVYVSEQLVGVGVRGKLKDTSPRKVPYWYATPAQALVWFDSMKPMHPDTLGHRWAAEMQRLGYAFELHDLRRTFITRAVAERPINEVRLAVGHDDLSTTSGYLQDVRDLDDEPLR